MNAAALQLADTIMYEGYSLYPYRASALKNQQRWHFGVLYPPAFCLRADANDAWAAQAQVVLADVTDAARVRVTMRFLQLHVNGAEAREFTFDLPREGVVRESIDAAPIRGFVEMGVTALSDGIARISVRVENSTEFDGEAREAALRVSMVSAHLIFEARGARFVSSIAPAPEFAAFAAGCSNVGLWPALLRGDEGEALLLAAPFIVGDFPALAPQSGGDHFDCTEIDEMLALRILTLTEAEKAQMRVDARTRAMLERVEAQGAERLAALHGVVRPVVVRAGQRVRLRPKRRADVFDIVLAGKIAVVESILNDAEGRAHFAVTVEDDPGRDLGRSGQPGHRFFFDADEIEVI